MKFFVKSISTVLAAAAALGFAGIANAGLVQVGDVQPGNDNEASVEALAGEDLDLLGRFNVGGNDDDGVLDTSAYFSLTENGTTGSVTFDLTGSGYILKYVVLKAGNEFTLFSWDMDPLVGSFDWSTAIAGLLGPQGQAQDLSHITFYGGTTPDTIPLPGAFWLMGAAIAAGAASRRNKKNA